MKEKDFQRIFNKWCKYNITKSSAFELKLTKSPSLPFSSVVEHQLNALHLAKNKCIVYKIPDDSMGQKPFDSFVLSNVPAYIVVMFYTRATKIFYLIDIDVWIEEEKTSKRKSLTEKRAREIGVVCSF